MINKIKLQNLRDQIDKIGQEQLKLRREFKRIFQTIVLESNDDKKSMRAIRIAFFIANKKRFKELIDEEFEFFLEDDNEITD